MSQSKNGLLKNNTHYIDSQFFWGGGGHKTESNLKNSFENGNDSRTF
jgi:hypothetical protein